MDNGEYAKRSKFFVVKNNFYILKFLFTPYENLMKEM